MKKIFFTAVSLFFALFLSGSLCGQAYEDNGFLIRFEDGTHPDTIQQIMEDYNSVEMWVSPLTETRYWVVTSFPFVDPHTGNIINNINELNNSANNKNEVDETDLNLVVSGLESIGPIAPTSLPNGHGICYVKANEVHNDENQTLKISILDTGFDNQSNNVTPSSGYNYIDNNSELIDDHGHGTQITNLIVNTIELNSQLSPQYFEWDVRKTHNSDGQALMSNIILALEESAVAGSKIINLSAGTIDIASNVNFLEKTIEKLETLNILIVNSAGNDEMDLDKDGFINAYPTEFESYNLIPVGSINCQSQNTSDFSNVGYKSVDITAPGENIPIFNSNNYSTVSINSGCSFSCAIVTGVAAVLASKRRAFDYKEIKCAILKGSTYISSHNYRILSSGLLNFEKALTELNNGCNEIIKENPHSNPPVDSRNFQSGQNIKIYPNPLFNTAKIESTNKLRSYKIIDLFGHTRISEDLKNKTNFELDTSHLPSGFYFLDLILESGNNQIIKIYKK